ncbi:hypothetical protein OAS39_01570 [Pirellulales bacterium]|nr:hypothetical protein [Pirellulales bacterium]
MKASTCAAACGVVRGWVALLLVAMLLVAQGCDAGAPPPEGQLAIEEVARWYRNFRAANRNRPPANEKQFVAYIDSRSKARGDTTDIEQLLTSPRDGQRYVVQYGKPNSRSMDRNVAVHEQEGYDGKILVAFEVGYIAEVDDAELEVLLARK